MAPARDPTDRLDALASEVSERLRRGETPRVETYCAEHPDLADDLREIFPVLLLFEELKTRTGSVGGAPRGAGVETGPEPDRIGPYRVVRRIGRGGMGVVYEARSPSPGPASGDGGDLVAVKVIHPHLLVDEEYVARFLREADAGRRVDHPAVVAVRNTGLADVQGVETPYLVLELVRGRNLRELVREAGPLPERLCRHVALHLAGALVAVHAAGLVHRDVKPENVMVTTEEAVKLMDLGVAVLRERSDRISRTGAFVGSLLYAAPEQVAGGAPSPAWDLYALGLLLAEIATGRFVDPRRESVERLEGAMSPFFRGVLTTLLARDPNRRFSSAAALRDVLRDGEGSTWWRARRVRSVGDDLVEGAEPLPFVGRSGERSLLDDAWDDVRAGGGRTLLLVGEAGMGKTRLLAEWLRSLDDAAAAWCRLVLPHAPGVGGPAGRLATAIRSLVGTDPKARLTELFGDDSPRAARVARLLELSEGESAPDSALMEEALAELLRRVAAEQPVVVVFEDLHFAGENVRRRFVSMANGLRRSSVLLIGTSRPDPAPAWAAELERLPHFQRVDLQGLDEEACRELVRAATEGAPHRPDSVHELARRSDGNPYFLLELVRAPTRRTTTGGRTTTPGRAVPDSLHSLLVARLARLESEDRELLQAAACAGFAFDPELVAEASGGRPITALTRLGRLERETRLLRSDGAHLRFHHHLLQEVLYEETLPALRAAWHAALGDALERRGNADDGERAVSLATHFLEGGRPERAVPHLPRAFEFLEREAHAYARNAALAEQALAHEHALPPALLAQALVHRSNVGAHGGSYERRHEDLLRAVGLAAEGGAGRTEIEACRSLAELEAALGRRERALEYFELTLSTAERVGDRIAEAHTIGRYGMELSNLGRPDEGLSRVLEGLERLKEAPSPYMEGRLHSYASEIQVRRGDLDDAERHLALAGAAARSVEDLGGELIIEGARGRLAFRQGRFADANRHAERYLELGRRTGYTAGEALYLGNQALCLFELGRLEQAAACAEESIRLSQGEGAQGGTLPSHAARGKVRLALGRLGDALSDARLDHELALIRGLREAAGSGLLLRVEVIALLGRGEEARRAIAATVALCGDDPPARVGLYLASARGLLAEHEGAVDEAVAAWREAAAMGRETSRPAARTALPLGRCLLRQGRVDEARGLLEQALRWGRKSGCLRYALMSEVFLAHAGLGDALAARVALEHGEGGLPVARRIEAHLLLHALPDGEGHLARARHWLDLLVDGAPAGDREGVRTRVDVHRRVLEAAGVT